MSAISCVCGHCEACARWNKPCDEAARRERERLDAIEHAQDRDYWRTERERLDRLDEEETDWSNE